MQRRPLCALAVLALASEDGVEREMLATLVWPELPVARAVGALKEALTQLRADLEAPDLVTGGQVLRLNPRRITSDIEELRRAAAVEDHAGVVAAFGGPLLSEVLDGA